IGTAAVPNGNADSHHAYLTNFDSYVMVLQLGTVLHLVPHWNQNFILRVMCFVEHQQDVAEEYRRVAKLLRDLRVNAELHVHYLQGSELQTYDRARMQAAAKTSKQALPPNAKPMDISAPAADNVPSTPSTGFSMRVNLPMPARYEARRFDTTTSTSATAASNSSSTSCSTASSSEESDSDSSDSDARSSLVSRRQSAQRPRKHRLHLMGSLFNGSGTPRRRSDGSMVLSNFYTQTFASLRQNRHSDSTKKGKRKSQHNLLQDTEENSVLEFNDMAVQTQNCILNELMYRHSRQGTKLIFTTLQAPEPGILQSKDKADAYLDNIDALAKDLPPVFLVHATSLTVTTSL
ncbi:hypothetical protein IWW36_005557, partial [Coemansia brasiliensis]